MDLRPLNIGSLNQRVTIEKPGAGNDDFGQPVTTWSLVATVWAAIRYLNGLETLRSGMETNIARASIRVHYLPGVVPAMRVMQGENVFNVIAVLPDPSGAIYMDLVAEIIAVGIPIAESGQFAGGALGIWYDPSEFATQTQDSIGVTPVTGMLQPIGQIFDKSGRANTSRQSTATARPILNSRINLFTGTDNPEHWLWNTGGVTPLPLANAWGKLVETAENRSHDFFQLINLVAGQAYTYTRKYKAGERTNVRHKFGDWDNIHICFVDVDLLTKQITAQYAFGNAVYLNSLITTNADQSVTVSLSVRYTLPGEYLILTLLCVNPTNALMQTNYQGDGVSGLYSAEPQLEKGIKATRYQWVSLDNQPNFAGFPIYHLFEIDDFLLTGPIVLGPDMDCFIGINRSGIGLQSLFSTAADTAPLFGTIDTGSSALADIGCGGPTYAVNGVALNGGLPGVSRGQLAAALPLGNWVILEIKNLDLSAFPNFKIGGFLNAGYNGKTAGIIVCVAGNTLTRRRNRQNLGAKVGLVLP